MAVKFFLGLTIAKQRIAIKPKVYKQVKAYPQNCVLGEAVTCYATRTRSKRGLLLNLNFGSCFGKLCFNCFCLVFGNTFFKWFWSAVNQVFSLFKAKACKVFY